jgi:hypothetical protein
MQNDDHRTAFLHWQLAYGIVNTCKMGLGRNKMVSMEEEAIRLISMASGHYTKQQNNKATKVTANLSV